VAVVGAPLLESAAMPTSRLRALLPVVVLLAVVLLPTVAGAQTPAPGEHPEATREWTWYMSWLVLAGTFGVVALIVFSFLRLSGRFYGKEEPPKVRLQPQYAGVNAPAYPAPAVQQPAPQPAPAPAAPAQTAAPPAPEAPAQEAAEEKPEAEAQPEKPEPEEKPEEKPEAEAQPEKPEPEEKPEEKPEAEAQPEEKPKAEAQPDEKPAAGGEDDVYERVLKEQLDKGVSPKVAEGRAKAAALKAKRAQGGE